MAHDTSEIGIVSSWRAEEGLKEIDYSKLKAESGSLNPILRIEAQRKLLQYFDISPEKSSEQAESVDLVEMFEKFPPRMQLMMLDNLVAFQLTKGCNGRCAFCLFGSKKGIESKFSFESVVKFLELHHDRLRKWGSSNVAHYWDSDPFDYQDGEHTYVDVYQEWRKHFPKKYLYISTTIPKGSVDSFTKFTKILFNRFIETRLSNEEREDTTIRVSVGKHNIQRVEATFKQLNKEWADEGKSTVDIELFMKRYFSFSPRMEGGINPLGEQIKNHDDIHDSSSPSCEDGVLITPVGIEAISMTAATIYEPSGQHNTPINPETPIDQIPSFVPKSKYQGFEFFSHMSEKYLYHRVLFPLVTSAETIDDAVELQSPVEDTVFKLGRWSFSLGGMVGDISDLDTDLYGRTPSEDTRQNYLKVCSSVLKGKLPEIETLINKAKEMMTEEKK